MTAFSANGFGVNDRSFTAPVSRGLSGAAMFWYKFYRYYLY